MRESFMVCCIIGLMACGKAATSPSEATELTLTSEPGLQGPTGEAGASCTVEQTEEGAVIRCPDGSTALLMHGQTVETCKRGGKHGKAHNNQDAR